MPAADALPRAVTGRGTDTVTHSIQTTQAVIPQAGQPDSTAGTTQTGAESAGGGNPKTTLTAVGLGLIVMLLWGSLFPFVKYGYKVFEIDTSFYPNLVLFAGVRFLVSGALLSAFCLATRRTYLLRQPKKRLPTALVALFAVVLHYACTYISLGQIDSSKTALLKQSGVLVFVCFSFLFFRDDRLTPGKIIGAVCGVASVLVINLDSFKITFGLGTALVIGASFCTVISNIVFKKSFHDVPAVTVTGYSQFMGGLFLTVLGVALGGRITSFGWRAALVMLYIVAATVVSYGLWYYVVQKYALSKLFIIKMAEPLFAALVSVLLPLGTHLTWQHAAAFALVAVAVCVSNIQFPKRSKIKKTVSAASNATEEEGETK